MSNRVIEFVKQHPYGVAAGVIGVYLAFRLLSGGGTAQTVTDTTTASEIAAGNQLNLAQLQAQQMTQQVNAAASVANNQTSAQLSAVQISAQSSDNQNSNNNNTAQIIAQLEAQTQATVSTLSATVAQAQLTTQEGINANNNATQLSIASLPYELAAAQLASQPNVQLQQQVSQVAQGLYLVAGFLGAGTNSAATGVLNQAGEDTIVNQSGGIINPGGDGKNVYNPVQ